jgi:hypothetical protein
MTSNDTHRRYLDAANKIFTLADTDTRKSGKYGKISIVELDALLAAAR